MNIYFIYSCVTQMVKNLPAMWEIPHSSILAWRIPWTEEPGGLESRGSQKSLDTTEATEHTYIYKVPKMKKSIEIESRLVAEVGRGKKGGGDGE